MKVLIAVTHLLGTGHLSRGLTLGRAFADADHQVTIVSGGFAAPQLNADGIDLLQLPPLRSDGIDFTRLLTASGVVADADYYRKRQVMLCNALTNLQPDILFTELYPFGRRRLANEFQALLTTAQAQPRPPVVLLPLTYI